MKTWWWGLQKSKQQETICQGNAPVHGQKPVMRKVPWCTVLHWFHWLGIYVVFIEAIFPCIDFHISDKNCCKTCEFFNMMPQTVTIRRGGGSNVNAGIDSIHHPWLLWMADNPGSDEGKRWQYVPLKHTITTICITWSIGRPFTLNVLGINCENVRIMYRYWGVYNWDWDMNK